MFYMVAPGRRVGATVDRGAAHERTTVVQKPLAGTLDAVAPATGLVYLPPKGTRATPAAPPQPSVYYERTPEIFSRPTNTTT